jgi:hypothetical protein
MLLYENFEEKLIIKILRDKDIIKITYIFNYTVNKNRNSGVWSFNLVAIATTFFKMF